MNCHMERRERVNDCVKRFAPLFLLPFITRLFLLAAAPFARINYSWASFLLFSLSLSTEALKVCVRAAAFCICLASDKRVLSLSRNNADIYPGRMKKNGRRNGRLLRNMLHTHLSVHSAPSYSHLTTLSSYFLRDKKSFYTFRPLHHTRSYSKCRNLVTFPRDKGGAAAKQTPDRCFSDVSTGK